MVTPTRLAYCAIPHSVTFTPPVFFFLQKKSRKYQNNNTHIYKNIHILYVYICIWASEYH